MGISIKVAGIQSVKKFVSYKQKETFKRANDAIKKAGFFIETEVADSIAGRKAETKSVDTGFFLKSILAIFPKPLTANIGSNKYPVVYANHLEYGTSRMRGRHHFKNTATRSEKKVKDFIEKEIKKIR